MALSGARKCRFSKAAGSHRGRDCAANWPLTSPSVACVKGCTRHLPSKFFIRPGRASLKSICRRPAPLALLGRGADGRQSSLQSRPHRAAVLVLVHVQARGKAAAEA